MSTPPPILPLPESTRSRLRSTLTIPHLPHAVSELLQNAIDASATAITLSLNPTRPSLTLTDNGHGIHPHHLATVGTLYTTSKHDGTYFGSRGEALAALALHSVLTITSRAAGWRCTRQLRWSYGSRVFEGPAPEYAVLDYPGTSVRVEGLWGDMPVRQRAWEGVDKEREWEEVIRVIAGVLLSGRGRGVGVVARDGEGTRRLTVSAGVAGEPWDLMVLRQSFGRDLVGGREGWECVKAHQNGVSIEGWARSRGCPHKNLQFLAVNGFPLPTGETELHREVNRVFAASGFGVAEEGGMGRRGGTRKGVDRYGMFVLRIECREAGITLGGEGGTEGKAGVEGKNLRLVIQLLQRLVYEFLKAHYHKPYAIASTPTQDAPKPVATPPLFTQQSKTPRSRSPTPESEGTASSKSRTRILDLENWSRVKSAHYDPQEAAGRCTTGGHKRLALPTALPTASTPAEPSSETIPWTDPASGKAFLVDIRTGNTAPQQPLKRTLSATTRDTRITTIPTKRSKSNPEPSEFIQHLLSTWENPAFPLTAPSIPSPPLPTSLGKLSKISLRSATVIAQVDSKYILLKLPPSPTSPELLVMLDQHAASERVRVEQLFRELFPAADPEPTRKVLLVPMSARDLGLLRRFREEFMRWGVRYQVYDTAVEVSALPRVARDRCEGEPKLVGELLRRHVYDLEERGGGSGEGGGGSGGGGGADGGEDGSGDGDGERSNEAVGGEEGEEDWVRNLSLVPKVLKEMVNSRACRGAVMFNDPLTRDECVMLVQKLAECRWPFMCAHGRVSMRPLVGLDGAAGMRGGVGSELRRKEKKGGFRDAVAKQRQRMEKEAGKM